MTNLISFVFYLIYVAISLNPLIIIFMLKNIKFKTTVIYQFIIPNSIMCIFSVIIISFCISYLYIYYIKKHNEYTQSEQMNCIEIEIAEPKYIPIYIAYFVIALSVDNWKNFCFIFILICLLILKGKFSYFNPYLLFSYNFYEISINEDGNKYAKYKVFLISNQKIKNIKIHNNLIRLNDFTFLDKG